MRRLIVCGTTNIDKEAEGAGSRKPIEWVKAALDLDSDNPEIARFVEQEPAEARRTELGSIKDCPVMLTVCTDPEAVVTAAEGIDASAASVAIEPLDTELLQSEMPVAKYVPATISASAFPVYQKCPRRYYLERSLRLKPVEDDSSERYDGGRLAGHQMGSLVHRALELAPMSPRLELDTSRDYLDEILARDLELSSKLSDEDHARAACLLEALETMAVAERLSAAASAGRLFPEHRFSTLVDASLVSGSIDVLCRQDDGALVVDYKTDSLGEDGDLEEAARHHSLQMVAYAVAASRFGWGPNVEVVLVFLDREGAEVSRSFSAAETKAAEQELTGLIASMGDGLFRPLEAIDPGFCPGCVGYRGRHKVCATAARAATSKK
jgi:RecB family exonuclease